MLASASRVPLATKRNDESASIAAPARSKKRTRRKAKVVVTVPQFEVEPEEEASFEVYRQRARAEWDLAAAAEEKLKHHSLTGIERKQVCLPFTLPMANVCQSLRLA